MINNIITLMIIKMEQRGHFRLNIAKTRHQTISRRWAIRMLFNTYITWSKLVLVELKDAAGNVSPAFRTGKEAVEWLEKQGIWLLGIPTISSNNLKNQMSVHERLLRSVFCCLRKTQMILSLITTPCMNPINA